MLDQINQFDFLDPIAKGATSGFFDSMIQYGVGLVFRLISLWSPKSRLTESPASGSPNAAGEPPAVPHGETTPASSRGTESDPNPQSKALAELLEKGLKSPADWAALFKALEEAGAVFDSSSLAELRRLQQGVLDRTVPPGRAAQSVVELTEQALARAGITPDDVRVGERVAHRLNDEVATPDDAPPAVSVALTKPPTQWWLLSPSELDSRNREYITRQTHRTRLACDHAADRLTQLVALRDIRSLGDELRSASQLLANVPPLVADTRSLRLSNHTTRNLLRTLDQAAAASTELTSHVNRLFTQNPGSAAWSTGMGECRAALSRLIQHLKDRRDLRPGSR